MPAKSPHGAESVSRWRHLVGARGRYILATSGWSVVAKVCGAANLFVSVPFVLDGLGIERFGVWATLCAAAAFAGFLDFGFGNGAMNLIASARGRKAPEELSRIVFAAYAALGWVAFWLAVIGAVLWVWLPWNTLLRLSAAYVTEGKAAAAVVLAIVPLSVPLALATRLQLGLGRGERAYRWQALANLLTLGMVVALAGAGAGLPALTAAALGGPLLGQAVNTIDLYRAFRPVGFDPARAALVKAMRTSGLQFFLLQVSAVLAFSVDLPLVTAVLGPDEAARYAIAQRLFSVIPMGLSLLWAPLWPTYRDALAAGHSDWAARTFRRSLLGAVGLAGVCGLVLTTGFEHLSAWWLGAPPAVSTWLLLGFAAWCVVDAAGGAIATFLNAAGCMRPQMIIAVVFVVCCLPLKVWGASTLGATAVIWVTVVLCLLLNLLPLWLLRHRLAAVVRSRTY